MRRDTIVAAVVAAAIASTMGWAGAQTDQPSESDTPLAEATEQVVAVPGTKAKSVQERMLAQLRGIQQELHLLNHRAYNANHNIVYVAKRADLTAERLRILNQNLFVKPTSRLRGELSTSGFLGRIAQNLWAMCIEQSAVDRQYTYCDDQNYPPPSLGR